MKYSIVEPLPLSEQQEEYIIAGHASYQEYSAIYNEFVEAFPDAMNKFFETYSNNYKEMLEETIRRLHPTSPHFDHNILGPKFTLFRRNFISNMEDEYFGQSRNRLRVAEDTYKKLINHMEVSPEDVPSCAKEIVNILKETRAETEAVALLNSPGRDEVTPEQLASLITQLDDLELEDYYSALRKGDDPYATYKRIKASIDANEAKEVLPPTEDSGQEPQESAVQDQPIPEDIGGGFVEPEPASGNGDQGEHPEDQAGGDDTPH